MKKEPIFGWIQDASSLETLHDVVAALLPGTFAHGRTLERIRRLVTDEALREELAALLEAGGPYPYRLLRGRGADCQLTVKENMELLGRDEETAEAVVEKGGRGNAACTGIIQAALTAQNGRPYQSDWAAESYLRLGVTLGLLDWDGEKQLCRVSPTGELLARGSEAEARRAMVDALASYPPAVRILELLAQGGRTKFQLGGQLGFAEAGFTSVDQGLFLAYCAACPTGERAAARSNFEGTADKYARMICSMLQKLNLVESSSREVTEHYGGRSYTAALPVYTLTALGSKLLRDIGGNSSHKRRPKSVYYSMLATRAPDHDYLRYRRAKLIELLQGSGKTVEQLQKKLADEGLKLSPETILDDMEGLGRIGLTVEQAKGSYCLADKIVNLQLPDHSPLRPEITDIKDRLRTELKLVDHKYLQLVDLGVSGGAGGKDREYEIVTAELLAQEMGLGSLHLGGANRPDGVAWWKNRGIIIDNKAYRNGFAFSAHLKDEMVRYLEDNSFRDPVRTPNRWWEAFPLEVDTFYFLFVSSSFRGEYDKALENISYRTGVPGGGVSSEDLLLLAEKIKAGELTHEAFFDRFRNDLIRP
jgi:hypothetical protein